VLMLPYSDEIRAGSKGVPFAGWKDIHTCGGPCNYLDSMYTSPSDFFQPKREPGDSRAISMWGEMLGAASPDDYDKLVHSFDSAHPSGYELDDMSKVLAGYHQYLDKWGFRKAFPTDSSLFQAIGYRTYYFWQRVIEQSRTDNINDFLVISGWESTTIDNHSGLVDNHRFFKGDPKIIAQACQPEMLFIQPRRMIVAKTEKDVVDVFLINEMNRTGAQTLKITAKRPDGSVVFTTEKACNAIGGDTFGQLLAEGIEIPPANAAGMMTIEATLTPTASESSVLKRTDQVEVVDVTGAPILQNVAVVEPDQEVSATLRDVFHIAPSKFLEASSSNHLDAIVIASKSNKNRLMDGDSKDGQISKAIFKNILGRVKADGTRLVLWPDNSFAAEAFVRELANEKIIKDWSPVENLNAPWFGSWFFLRKHWLLSGLPTDCAMDWRYGVSAFSGPEWLKESPGGSVTRGFVMDADGMEAFIGFGADHNPKVGTAGCVIPYGRGEIVFFSLPQMVRSLQPGKFAMNPVICQRMLGNALRATAPSKVE
jgi:beta-galactosidase